MSKAFDLPFGVVTAVEDVRLDLLPGPHPYEAEHAADIVANWEAERALKPAIFDGGIALFCRLAIRDGALVGACHAGRYASFLHWRRNTTDTTVGHAYANALLLTVDGAVVGIEMGAHTVNAGKVAVAAGSFEPEDFHGGRADVFYNMRREIREETGLDLDACRPFPGWHVLPRADGTVIVKRFALPLTAAEAQARIARFIASEAEPEIARPVMLRDGGWQGLDLGTQMAQLLEWHFANPPAAG